MRTRVGKLTLKPSSSSSRFLSDMNGFLLRCFGLIDRMPSRHAVSVRVYTYVLFNLYVLQRKLDLWNRFQLAHGVGPTLMRVMVSVGIVGSTIYIGLFNV